MQIYRYKQLYTKINMIAHAKKPGKVKKESRLWASQGGREGQQKGKRLRSGTI